MAVDRAPAPGADAGAGHRSFLVYRNFLYLKVALVLAAVACLAYLLYDPIHGHSGNTWLGYTLGTLGAGLIIWLAALGVRKRQFEGGRGTVRGWTSAHVYLGLALALVATLHSGFQLGWNVHSLAYLLTMLVIASGIYGIIAYSALPRRITANRQQMDAAAMEAEIRRLDEAALRLAEKIDPETHKIVAKSVGKVQIGGSWWRQLSGYYRGLRELGALGAYFERKRDELAMKSRSEGQSLMRTGEGGKTLMLMADQLFEAGRGSDSGDLEKLLNIVTQRKALVDRLNRDVTLHARMNIWLFVHVPLTVALLAALAIHVLTVFLYW